MTDEVKTVPSEIRERFNTLYYRHDLFGDGWRL